MNTSFSRRLAVVPLATVLPAAALFLAPAADASLVAGTVVHRNARAHSFVVAGAAGRLVPIHAAHSPAIGREVVVSVRRLSNGTYALRRLKPAGISRRVRARGVVTYVDPSRGTFTLSAEGVSMLVQRGGGRAATAAAALPPVGTKVTVAGPLSGSGVLDAQSVRDDGTATGAIDLEGSVTAIDTIARTLSISSEDNALSGPSVTVTIPATFDMSKFTLGEEVQVQVTLQPDGTYVLQGSSSDEGTLGAEDQTDQQGEQTDAADQEDSSPSDHESSSSDHGSSSSDHEGSSSDN